DHHMPEVFIRVAPFATVAVTVLRTRRAVRALGVGHAVRPGPGQRRGETARVTLGYVHLHRLVFRSAIVGAIVDILQDGVDRIQRTPGREWAGSWTRLIAERCVGHEQGSRSHV